MKRILSLVLTLIMVFSCVGAGIINASAASSVMSFSKNEVKVGDTVTVTVTINADETMYSYGLNLHYDPEILEVKLSGNQQGGAGTVKIAESSKSKSVSVKCSFKALKAGTCYIRTSGAQYGNYDYEDVSVPNQGANLTVKDESLSKNANLKSLSLSSGKLSPSFSASATSYSVTVGKDITECDIYAVAQDDKAKVKVEGGTNLKIGSNSCTVTVTAQSGAQKVYNINITRTNEATQSTDSSEEETSSEEVSSVEPGSLETQIEGTAYTVAEKIDSIDIPLGFEAERIIYNAAEVTVIKDENENYTIYYLKSKDSKELQPYLLNSQTNSFEKLQYMKQGGRYYIFEKAPENDKFEGFYATNSEIGGFSVGCYSSTQSELSAFSYVYCFNGEQSGYYRYDSVEKVLQRYPEMKLAKITGNTVAEDEEEFGEKFSSLSSNRKIIVIGIVLLILCFLGLVILLVARVIHHHRSAEYATNLNYREEFDSIDYEDKFSLESGGFVAAGDDALSDLDFGDEMNDSKAPNYLIDDEPVEPVELDAEVETELLTEDDS